MNEGANPNWDGDLFRLYSQRMNPEDWQDDFLGQESEGGRQSGDRPRADGYGVGGEFSQHGLFGGPGADLYGADYGAQRDGSGQESGSADRERFDSGPMSMPSISQPMSPLSQSMPSISASMPSIPGQNGPRQDGSSQEEVGDEGSLMRPYARTRGRTRTEYDLAIETLVSTSERGRTRSSQATAEHRSICGLCTDARSIAEISAHLRLPLGVVRVLIGDMAGLGLVEIHESGMVVGDRPSMEFLERVLSGLRRL